MVEALITLLAVSLLAPSENAGATIEAGPARKTVRHALLQADVEAPSATAIAPGATAIPKLVDAGSAPPNSGIGVVVGC